MSTGPPSTHDDANATIRVLHVDDESGFAAMVATFLERIEERLSVETATSAEAGLSYVREHDVDCVISDHDMSGMNGIEFLEAVRETAPDLPFILYTGKGSEEVASEAITAGVTEYLQKESGTEQYAVLAHRVTNAVDRLRAERRAERTRTQLEAIAQNAVDGIVIIDSESEIQFANPAMESLFGYAPAELEGDSLTKLIPPRYRDPHREALERYVETNERSIAWNSVEFPGSHRDGHEFPVSVSFGEFDHDREIRFIGIIRDISERAQLEDALREREARLRQVAENIHEVVWMTEPGNSEVIYVNPAYEELWGRSTASAYADPDSFLEAIHPEDRERVRTAQSAQTDGEYSEEYRVVRPDGEIRWVWDRAIPVEDESGEVYRIVGIASDITEQKERERELERYENVLEAAGDGVYVLGLDGRFTMVNDRFAEITGYSRSELLDSHVSLYLDEADIEKGNRRIRKLFTTDVDVVHMSETIHTADGEEVPAEAKITLLRDETGTPIATTGVLRDVTEQREREHELERYETIFEELNDGIYVLDENENIVYVNEQYASMKGADREALLGAHITQWVDEATVERARALREKLRAGSRDVGTIETVLRRVDGTSMPVELRLLNTEHSGNSERIGVVRDITDRRDRERELERTRDLLEQTKRIADVGGWELDPETREVFWTEHLFTIFGIDRDEEPPLTEVLEIFHEEDRSTVRDAIERALEHGTSYEIEVRFRRPDGEIRWLRIQGTPTVEDGEVRTLRGAVQDITEQKSYERKLERQNARLEEFASVVSHDLRNPLHVAQGRLQLAKEECESEHLEPIEHAHERMETLITDLLTLAREGGTVTDREPVDLNAVIEGCWTNVETDGATLRTDIDRRIYAEESRLKQVFENLFRNSIEHGAKGSRESSDASVADERDDITVTVGELDDGFYLEDDGRGIPESERETIFDAGYSTGDAGTGFGLSIVERIVDAHGWEIDVANGSDGGARFEITRVEFVEEG